MTMNIAVDYVCGSTSAAILAGSLIVVDNNSINLLHCGTSRFSSSQNERIKPRNPTTLRRL